MRTKRLGDPSGPTDSWVQVSMSVKGATVEHHQDRPISRVILSFVEGPFDDGKVGELEVSEEFTISRLPPSCLGPTSLVSGLPSASIGSPHCNASSIAERTAY